MRTFFGWVVGILAGFGLFLCVREGLDRLNVAFFYGSGEIYGQDRFGSDLTDGGMTLEAMALMALSTMIAVRVGMTVTLLDWRGHLDDRSEATFLAWFFGLTCWTAIAIVLEMTFRGANSSLAPHVAVLIKAVSGIYIFSTARRLRRRWLERMLGM